MSSLITSESPIIPAHDKYWDSPMTRREARVLFNKLAFNDSELTGMADTAAILINYLCETLEVKREDVDAYVERKKAQLAAMREQMKAEVEGANNAQSNG